MSSIVKTEQEICSQRTDKMLASFRGNAEEFGMLKGLLCAGHKLISVDREAFDSFFNHLMIASRMDELRAEARQARADLACTRNSDEQRN